MKQYQVYRLRLGQWVADKEPIEALNRKEAMKQVGGLRGTVKVRLK